MDSLRKHEANLNMTAGRKRKAQERRAAEHEAKKIKLEEKGKKKADKEAGKAKAKTKRETKTNVAAEASDLLDNDVDLGTVDGSVVDV